MLVVETVARIRREHFVKGKTIKEIARDLKVSRNTVRRVLRSGETSFEYEREVQPRPKLGRWTAELYELLESTAAKAAREQLTLSRIFEELRGRGYDGGYDAVRRYARRWAKERGQATAAAYVPLSFAPGEAFQFDWSHEVGLLNGVTVIVKVAHVRLCHSRMLFVRAYPRETQEMVFDAHDRAFALFKGACGRGIYDNMKTAVETVFVGKNRLYNRRFLQMCSHYLVDPVACTPASGWEKGQVENQVGLVRERFFTPRLRFKTYDEMNAWLLDKCIAYAKAHHHPELIEQTIWEVFEAEPLLEAISKFLDSQHEMIERVRRDLVRGLKQPRKGRRGLTAPQVLRSLVVMRVKNWDYRELRERIADGVTLRQFTDFYCDPVPKHDAFNRGFNRLTPQTLKAVNDLVVQAAVALGLEDGAKLRVDTTVVETDIHHPTDNTLLWDGVRVVTR